MTESMIEKCRWAALVAADKYAAGGDGKDIYREIVRAVLNTLKEPDEGALFAACRGRRIVLSDFREAHSAMISHILKESESK